MNTYCYRNVLHSPILKKECWNNPKNHAETFGKCLNIAPASRSVQQWVHTLKKGTSSATVQGHWCLLMNSYCYINVLHSPILTENSHPILAHSMIDRCCIKVPRIPFIFDQASLFEIFYFANDLNYCFDLNLSPPSATYLHQWIRSALVQTIACRLFGTKPISKPILGYCKLHLK